MIVPVYCIDTSSILEAWRRHYPHDVFPGFWKDLQAAIDAGLIVSSEMVQRELARKDDDVATWAIEQQNCFIPVDEDQQFHLIQVLTDHELLVKNTKRRNEADPFVIALAKKMDLVIVTEEVSGGEKKPKIPDVCDAMKIKHVSVLGLMREENWSY